MKSSIANLMLTLPLIEQAAIVVRLGVVGLERDRLVEVVERLRAVPLLAVDDAAAEIGRRVGAVERKRPVVVGEREIELARVPIDAGRDWRRPARSWDRG